MVLIKLDKWLSTYHLHKQINRLIKTRSAKKLRVRRILLSQSVKKKIKEESASVISQNIFVNGKYLFYAVAHEELLHIIFTAMFSFYKIYLYICYFSWNKWFQRHMSQLV